VDCPNCLSRADSLERTVRSLGRAALAGPDAKFLVVIVRYTSIELPRPPKTRTKISQGDGHPRTSRRMEPGGKALENQWRSAAVRHYRAAEPSRLVKDVPLYTL
jgi:hypothetical protein